MRPVLNHICQYTWLRDGTVTMNDIAEMNEALDISAENDRRAREANR